jgi:hypothetical protein
MTGAKTTNDKDDPCDDWSKAPIPPPQKTDEAEYQDQHATWRGEGSDL